MNDVPADEWRALSGILLLYRDMLRAGDFGREKEAREALAVWLRDNGMPVEDLEGAYIAGLKTDGVFVAESLLTGRVCARLDWIVMMPQPRYWVLTLVVRNTKDGAEISCQSGFPKEGPTRYLDAGWDRIDDTD